MSKGRRGTIESPEKVMMKQMRLVGMVVVLALVAGAGAVRMDAQVAASAKRSGISLRLGATGSVFDPDYGLTTSGYYSTNGYGINKLGGVGAYADLNLFRGLGIEGEARWQRFHQQGTIFQDNYLVGPRFQMGNRGRLAPYIKALVGYGYMNYEQNYAHGWFNAIAVGGGLDVRVTRRISLRALDVEYQQWPQWQQPLVQTTTLFPYGVSAGVSYRLF